MGTKSPFREVADLIKEAGGEALGQCYQCGTCSATCPWRDYISFLPRRMFQEARLGLTDFESDSVWRCVTCNKCVQRCPRSVPILDLMTALRRSVIGMGIAETPTALAATLRNLSAVGNPSGEPAEARNAWSEGMRISRFTSATEYLFFPCCVTSYDPAMKNVARATAKVLSAAGVDFGILEGAVCCGESARKAGDEALFQQLAGKNTSLFNEKGVRKIIVNSPHCFNTLTRDYPEIDAHFEIVHTSQLFAELIREGRIKLSKNAERTVTYHDPCYLGRHSGIYDLPRNTIADIGANLVEIEPAKADALCCGGGGGRIWMDTPRDERFCEERLKQALLTGADTLITACPYCLSNFKDTALNQSVTDQIAIMDLSELIAEAL
ncbi:(Fe-S)-binding protein [Dehalogenimonas etheniformans]|uniref:(Fe-S)-binding protein n=1 Tax=Dehalogenimonas etheniformans TaxID=1536648 RepID=A0A2P5P9H0_9CHLR|nr:(Fe-S)-binding protein [Dehalogenimonas etheniformans]PPD58924.1 (Fe-S)-binding protein [Dehalogenimonas etheniformans]QNT76309.1 (Fe-S)-binding protein [Dehalogenimonas etheniformans]